MVVGGQPAFWPRTDFVDVPTGLRDNEIKQVRRAFGEAIKEIERKSIVLQWTALLGGIKGEQCSVFFGHWAGEDSAIHRRCRPTTTNPWETTWNVSSLWVEEVRLNWGAFLEASWIWRWVKICQNLPKMVQIPCKSNSQWASSSYESSII